MNEDGKDSIGTCPTPGEVLISLDYYTTLCEKAEKLDALERAGVDNWQNYDEAMRILHDREENEAAVAEMLAEGLRHSEGDVW